MTKQQDGIGHEELYKMGFDGAAIGQMRKLTPIQRRQLIKILTQEDTRMKFYR